MHERANDYLIQIISEFWSGCFEDGAYTIEFTTTRPIDIKVVKLSGSTSSMWVRKVEQLP